MLRRSIGTFEERINELLSSKKDLADMTVSAGETWIGDLPADELRTLLSLENQIPQLG